MTDPTPYLFWITARAGGIAALVLSGLAVSLGLSMNSSLVKRVGKANLRIAHEALALASIAAIVIHAGSLLGDHYLHSSVLDVTVPLVSSYQTLWTTLGILGGWGLILLGFSYYARKRIGSDRWRTLHRFTALAWLSGLIHALGEGTDSGQLWFWAMLAVVALPALWLLAARTFGRQAKRARMRPSRLISGA
ncbi:MAG TPA: ferric reductase-like transmembrane domain-containing protein [Solirubrobacteraceae bacterium]|jgi:sulfoxide reductase heme-binding subunit YedZ